MNKLKKVPTFLFFAIPLLIHAEVMDKELSIPQIWGALFVALLICLLSAVLWRWILVLSLFVGLLLTGLVSALIEWNDPFVGPAIRAEAGAEYGIHIYAAIVVVIAAHIVGWFVSSRRSLLLGWRKRLLTQATKRSNN